MRTFLALDLDEASVDRLATVRQAVGDRGEKINWVARENFHVTLNFLGEVRDEMAAEVFGLASEVAAGIEPFEFDVRGIVCVPPRGALRMIWAGIDDPTGRMARLHEGLSLALGGLGLKEEDRDFRPHITLARIKFAPDADAVRRAAATLADDDFGLQCANELVAYGSTLTPDGPIYTPLARARLGK